MTSKKKTPRITKTSSSNIAKLDDSKQRSNLPVTSSPKESNKFSFSFRFWKQIEYFGLSNSETKWFVSLLNQLNNLSSIDIDDFLKDGKQRNAYRYHKIKWDQKNIPVQRLELDWVDPFYLDNKDDYPFVQFKISFSFGRIIGFLDENRVFNVVLLDPLHNIQPSKLYNYKVDNCYPLACKHTTLLSNINEILERESCPKNHDCSILNQFKILPLNNCLTAGVFIYLLKEHNYKEILRLIEEGTCDSVEQVLEYGINHIDSLSSNGNTD